MAGFGLVAEHPHAYVACVGVLGCPLTHLCLQECESIMSECDSSALHCEITSSGTRLSSCKPVVLVTLRGCHLLDDLVVVSIEARKKFVRCSGEVIVRGVVLTPREPRRATLVERVIKLPSLVGRFLRCPTCGLGG